MVVRITFISAVAGGAAAMWVGAGLAVAAPLVVVVRGIEDAATMDARADMLKVASQQRERMVFPST